MWTFFQGSPVISVAIALSLAGCGSDGGVGSSGDTVIFSAPAQGITKIVINTAASEAVTFGGTSFGAVGQYQKIRGTVFVQLDPNDSKNAVIADMATVTLDLSGRGR